MTGTSTSYSRIADRYEAARGGADRAAQLANGLLPWLPAGGRILDVGAGTGIVSAELRQVAADVLGVDLSPEMIRQARERLAGHVAVADAAALPLPEASIDAVTFVWVLHLVGDPAAALRESARVLRPGGRAVVVWAHPQPPPPGEETAVHRIMGRLSQLRSTTNPAGEVRAAAAAAGFRLVAEASVALSYQSSPADTADAIEQRLFSWLWDLPAETWRDVVQPGVDELRALPDAERKVAGSNHHPLWIWER